VQRFRILIAGLLFLGACILLRAADPTLMSTLRGAGFDTLQRVWPRQSSPQAVRVVDIDEASLHKLGQWPWPRDRVATMVENLNSLGAAAIVFDIIFAEPDRTSPSVLMENPDLQKNFPTLNSKGALPNYDQIFASTLAGKPVVGAFAGATSSGRTASAPKASFAQTGLNAINAPLHLETVTSNLPELDAAATGLGIINLDLTGNQGIARQIPLLWTDGKQFYPSLSLEALRVAQGADTFVVNGSDTYEDTINSIRVGELEIPTNEHGFFPIYYHADEKKLYVSALDLLDTASIQKLRPEIEGNIVLIGTSATGLLDTRSSTLGESIPGVSVHAQALEQILSGQFLSRPDWVVAAEFWLVGIAGLLLSALASYLRPLPLMWSWAGMVAALGVAVAYAFRSAGLLVDFTFPFLALFSTFLAALAYKLLVTDKQGRDLRNAFSHYVAPSVLAEIENNPSSLKLGGEQREVTVMFVDIANFTRISEVLEPAALVGLVNEILSTCTQAILRERGTVDKYIGDAVMAFWNAPVRMEEHQYHACLAALDIQSQIPTLQATQDTSTKLQSEKLWPITVRVGLASGPATVGNMGSNERFDYSVLGETVNIAARAEAACKETGCNITLVGNLIGKSQSLTIKNAGKLTLRGKTVPLQAFGILAKAP
jgi:adenylate cyclase